MAEDSDPFVVNVNDLSENERLHGDHYGVAYKCLTPSMLPRGGRLGVNHMRVPRGRSVCPFHYHLREDEVFFVLSGLGVLRYGDELRAIGPGDCISCPAGTKIAHQIHNPNDEDLVYLAIGPRDPHEVCVYPDSGKVAIGGLGQRGTLTLKPYYEDEPEPPRIIAMAKTVR